MGDFISHPLRDKLERTQWAPAVNYLILASPAVTVDHKRGTLLNVFIKIFSHCLYSPRADSDAKDDLRFPCDYFDFSRGKPSCTSFRVEWFSLVLSSITVHDHVDHPSFFHEMSTLLSSDCCPNSVQTIWPLQNGEDIPGLIPARSLYRVKRQSDSSPIPQKLTHPTSRVYMAKSWPSQGPKSKLSRGHHSTHSAAWIHNFFISVYSLITLSIDFFFFRCKFNYLNHDPVFFGKYRGPREGFRWGSRRGPEGDPDRDPDRGVHVLYPLPQCSKITST